MKSCISVVLLGALALTQAPAYAQAAEQQAVTAGQGVAAAARKAATQDVDPNALVRGAVQMLALVDSNRAGELWDSGSPVAKQAVARLAFVDQVARERAALGAPVQRAWMTVRRQEVSASAQTPPGIYATVEFATTFASKKTVLEMVSMRMEADGRWWFAGYVIRK